MTSRLPQLQQMLQRTPDDVFLLYAIALEHKKLGDLAEALSWLDKVTQKDPAYCVAYHQAGLIHEQAGNVEAARQSYRQGIDIAQRKGDLHAKAEMEEALSLIA